MRKIPTMFARDWDGDRRQGVVRTAAMFGCVIALSVLGGTAAHFTGGYVYKAVGWFTPMAIGTVVGFWLAKR